MARHVRPDIEPDYVHQRVTGAVGQSDERACQRVHFLDGVAVLYRDSLDRAAEEAADPVGDEVRRVLAMDHTFPQVNVAKMGNKVQNFGLGGWAGDHLRQVQIARRIEEVRAEKMTPQLIAKSSGDSSKRQPAG